MASRLNLERAAKDAASHQTINVTTTPRREKMKLLYAAGILLAVGCVPIHAQDLHSIAPPAILQMDNLPNAGELLIRYCMLGDHLCVERSTSCHGQCCDQSEADSLGYNCSGNVFGVIPPGSHYAGWRCQMYAAPVSAVQLSGKAGPVPEYIKQCKNNSWR